MVSLSKQHTLNLLIDDHHSKKAKSHHLSMSKIIDKQWYKIKSSIIDSNNWLNKIFSAFDKLHKELSSSFRLVDNFSNHYSFHTVNWKNTEVKNAHLHFLDKIFDDFLSNPDTVLVISDVCVKNKVATLISYIHQSRNIIAKTIYYAIDVTSTKAELFSIKCGINQAIQVSNAENIIVITNTIHTTRQIFDSFSYPY